MPSPLTPAPNPYSNILQQDIEDHADEEKFHTFNLGPSLLGTQEQGMIFQLRNRESHKYLVIDHFHADQLPADNSQNQLIISILNGEILYRQSCILLSQDSAQLPTLRQPMSFKVKAGQTIQIDFLNNGGAASTVFQDLEFRSRWIYRWALVED